MDKEVDGPTALKAWMDGQELSVRAASRFLGIPFGTMTGWLYSGKHPASPTIRDLDQKTKGAVTFDHWFPPAVSPQGQ